MWFAISLSRDSFTYSVNISLSKLQEIVKDRGKPGVQQSIESCEVK